MAMLLLTHSPTSHQRNPQGVVTHVSNPHHAHQPPFLLLDDGTGVARLDLRPIVQNRTLGTRGLEGVGVGTCVLCVYIVCAHRKGTLVHVSSMASIYTYTHIFTLLTGEHVMAVGVPLLPSIRPSTITAHQCVRLSHGPLRETLWMAEVVASWSVPPAGIAGGAGVGKPSASSSLAASSGNDEGVGEESLAW